MYLMPLCDACILYIMCAALYVVSGAVNTAHMSATLEYPSMLQQQKPAVAIL